MALINCPSCGKKMSNKSPSCPHCGFSTSATAEDQERMRARKAATRFRRLQMGQMTAVLLLMIGGGLWWYGSMGEGATAGWQLAAGQGLLILAVLLYVFTRGTMLWDKHMRK